MDLLVISIFRAEYFGSVDFIKGDLSTLGGGAYDRY